MNLIQLHMSQKSIREATIEIITLSVFFPIWKQNIIFNFIEIAGTRWLTR